MSAVPACSGAVLPTRSEIEEWDTSDLSNAATTWRNAATASEDLFDQHRQNIAAPGGTTWEGDAKDAALDRVTADVAVVGRQSGALREAADLAENGAYDIKAAQDKAVEAINAAENDGFRVGEDLSVTDTRKADIATMGARHTAAAEHAEDIRWNAEQLAQADKLVGERLQAKAAELEGIRFDNEGAGEGTIRLVDNEIKLDPPPSPPPPGPKGEDIAKVLDQLPSDSRPNIKVVRSQADLDRLWEWMRQNGVDNPGRYGGNNGVSVDLPDGTSVGKRAAARSTGQSALDVSVPGRGYIKVHINPDKGAEPRIPAQRAPIEAPRASQAEPVQAPKPAPPQPVSAEPARPAPPVEAPKAAPVEPRPPVRGWGGPSAESFGPQLVYPPGSIREPFPILGEGDPGDPGDSEAH
ncbi:MULTISPECIES: WXG100 family type VII secretion target [Mycolicibacterium]|uniref:WXG100 family type VII secretion target n=1 Tax=Mycolicibacterium TaxID=1866885 RepID=UPI001E5D213D|nr:hypothetical protein [Mycolicibacterium mageritense]GJJ21157.1 hypothetical protein MTY414_48300 [Mycolicibacterium mageritense]